MANTNINSSIGKAISLYFNKDLSTWNISQVTNMSFMFAGASSLSQTNKCAIYESWKNNPAFISAGYGSDWCTSSQSTSRELTHSIDLPDALLKNKREHISKKVQKCLDEDYLIC